MTDSSRHHQSGAHLMIVILASQRAADLTDKGMEVWCRAWCGSALSGWCLADVDILAASPGKEQGLLCHLSNWLWPHRSQEIEPRDLYMHRHCIGIG